MDRETGRHRVFASGLRNPVGMAWESERGALWVAVNERDELGSDIVPDYMTSVGDGAFYGCPAGGGRRRQQHLAGERLDAVGFRVIEATMSFEGPRAARSSAPRSRR